MFQFCTSWSINIFLLQATIFWPPIKYASHFFHKTFFFIIFFKLRLILHVTTLVLHVCSRGLVSVYNNIHSSFFCLSWAILQSILLTQKGISECVKMSCERWFKSLSQATWQRTDSKHKQAYSARRKLRANQHSSVLTQPYPHVVACELSAQRLQFVINSACICCVTEAESPKPEGRAVCGASPQQRERAGGRAERSRAKRSQLGVVLRSRRVFQELYLQAIYICICQLVSRP